MEVALFSLFIEWAQYGRNHSISKNDFPHKIMNLQYFLSENGESYKNLFNWMALLFHAIFTPEK